VKKRTETADLPKILNQGDLLKQIEQHRQMDHQIVFTNGCFDILHVGHVRYLKSARSYGDILVVGLNSDASVKQIKGINRPINCQDHRAEVLSSLACIDYVTIFKESDPLELIKVIKPDVLAKGDDWAASRIIGALEVQSIGGQVIRVPVVPDISTSRILRRIIKGASR
jgi:rfaE bifunctional protein nucleotidyltransferase chain/domain